MVAGIFKNRVTEKDIRDWLDKQEYDGRSATITDLELHAIKRPGWRQLFRFSVHLKREFVESSDVAELNAGLPTSSAVAKTCYGIVQDDQRQRRMSQQTQIQVFDSLAERDQKLDELSAGMLTCGGEQNTDLKFLLLLVVGFIVGAMILGTCVGCVT